MKIIICDNDQELYEALESEGMTPTPLPEGTFVEVTRHRQESMRFVMPYRLTDDDLLALRAFYTSKNEDDAAIMAPDRGTEIHARQMYRRGKELSAVYTSWISPNFPFGADPFGARLDEFKRKHDIVAWIAVDAGYIATSLQRAYVGAGVRKQ